MDRTVAGASTIFDDELGVFQSELNSKAIRGSLKLVQLTENIVAEEYPEDLNQIDVIYVNDTSSSLTVGVSNTRYRTPNGELVVLTVPAGGYAEVNFLNIGGTVFVRGL